MGTSDLDKLTNGSPVLQDAQLGELLKDIPVVVQYAVTADATGALTIPIPYDMLILDIIVECTTANASGTLTLRKATTAISDAIVCAVDKTIVRAGTIDDAQSTILTTESINVLANGAADRGKITIIGKRT